MIYALCRKIDFVENLRVFGVKIWTGISIRVKNLTFSMSVPIDFLWKWSIMDQNANANAFSQLQKNSEVSSICHMKADVLPFPKMWCFLYTIIF